MWRRVEVWHHSLTGEDRIDDTGFDPDESPDDEEGKTILIKTDTLVVLNGGPFHNLRFVIYQKET